MRRQDSKTSPGFTDLEIPISERHENGEMLSRELADQDFREREAHERKVANLRRLWVSRRFLGRVTLAGLLLSTLMAFIIPKHYQSVARLMPPDNESGVGGLAMAASALTGSAAGGLGGLGGLASDLLGQKTTSDLYVGVLGSSTVEDKLIQQFNLKHVYHDRRIEDARKDLERLTDIEVDRKSQIITLTVTDKSPQRATAMAQAYVDELNRVLASVSTSSAHRERVFLEGRLKSVTQDLEVAEKQFSQFASKNATLDIKEQGKAMVGAAETLQGELIAARSELEGLRQIYSDNNVRVRSAQARVDELDTELKKLGGVSDAGASDSGAADASLYPSIRELPILGVPYADLYRRIKVEEAVFEMLTQKYELAKVQEAKETPTVRELDVPKLPEKKSFPPRILLILLGTVLSFSCAVAWLFGRDKWEQVDPADPGKRFAQEVLESMRTAIPRSWRNGHGAGPEDSGAGGEGHASGGYKTDPI